MTDNRIEKIKAEIERLYNQSLADENRQADRGLERAANVSYGKSKVCKELLSFIDTLQEEPVSEEQVKKSLISKHEDKTCKENGNSLTQEEDLKEAAKHYLYSNILYDDVYVGNPTDKDCIEMFKAGANWQKEQDKETIELAEDHAMLAGMEKMKEQLMKNAIEGKVLANGMGNPILHLWDKGKHLIDKKVKVIVIKEN